MKKISIIGIVGVPAKYGGFETLVENIIGDNCSHNIEYTVYCSSKSYSEKVLEYKGAKLKYVGLKANGVQSIPYDIISILRAIRKCDVMLILGISGCMILPVVRLFSRKRIVVNIDGLEHRRDKWSPKVRKFLKWSEQIAVKNADVIISDNKAIADYVKQEYDKDSLLIAYGGDHVQCDASAIEKDVLEKYSIQTKEYCFSLCRIEPENNVHTILEAFSKSGKRLLFVGNWKNSAYGKDLQEKYSAYSNISMLLPIYELGVLQVLRSNCLYYIHGHSAGGTNPSLVEAMFFGIPIFAFDCSYNRESTFNEARYFANSEALAKLTLTSLEHHIQSGNRMLEIAKTNYIWNVIAQKYESSY